MQEVPGASSAQGTGTCGANQGSVAGTHTCSKGSSTKTIRSGLEKVKACLGSFLALKSASRERICFVVILCFHNSKEGSACAALDTRWSSRKMSADTLSNSAFNAGLLVSSLQTCDDLVFSVISKKKSRFVRTPNHRCDGRDSGSEDSVQLGPHRQGGSRFIPVREIA